MKIKRNKRLQILMTKLEFKEFKLAAKRRKESFSQFARLGMYFRIGSGDCPRESEQEINKNDKK